MTTLTLINGNKETLPVLVTSTKAKIYFTSSDEISVYVGNTQNDMSLYRTFRKNEAFGFSFSMSYNSEYIAVTDLAIGSYVKIASDTALTSATLQWSGEEALLITPVEVSMLSRPCYTDEQKTLRFINEAEQNDIRPALGDDVFLSLKKGENVMLLNGGQYKRDGKTHIINGVKRALAYYVHSRLLESGSVDLTRQGAVYRRSDSSDKASDSDVVRISRETYAIADRYMQECLEYLNADTKHNSNRVVFFRIGD